jgi:thioredoxin-like negative regulator of GroEL
MFFHAQNTFLFGLLFQESATEFKISAVPTFVLSKDGETVNKFSGADKVQLEQFIKDL